MKYRVLCDTKAYLVMSGKGPYLYECLREGDIIDGDAKDGSVCYPNAKGYVYMVSLTDVSPLFPESRGTTANEFNRMQAMADLDDLPKEANMPNTTDINSTLAERGSRYGSFDEHARITQNIKDAMRDSPNWDKLPHDMKESLEMNAHKVGRILNGDPNCHDSWHDIVGYTKLVADRLAKINGVE